MPGPQCRGTDMLCDSVLRLRCEISALGRGSLSRKTFTGPSGKYCAQRCLYASQNVGKSS
jgi:hypothetical protein